MDVDPITVTGQMTIASTNLKRSTSAPMINDLASSVSTPSVRSSIIPNRLCTSPLSHLRTSSDGVSRCASSRFRRFSATFLPATANAHPPVSPGGASVRTPSRLLQIRQEEALEEREIRHERDVHTALQMSQSCEDLALADHVLSSDSVLHSSGSGAKRLPADCPLHLAIGGHSGGSSGGLRASCLSPGPLSAAAAAAGGRFSHHQPFSPPASPSPTRRASLGRRSMSPVTLRPSPLGAFAAGASKRKWHEATDPAGATNTAGATSVFTPKRFHSGGCGQRAMSVSPGASMLLATVTTTASSSSSAVASPTADSSVAFMALSAVDTPDSMSSAGSPSVSARCDSPPLHCRPATASATATADSSAAATSHVFRPVHHQHDDVAMETGACRPSLPSRYPPPSPSTAAMETSLQSAGRKHSPSRRPSSVDVNMTSS